LDQAAPKRLERWRRIALEACQQCRRDFLPEIELPVKFVDLVKREAGLRLLLDETAGPELAMLSRLPAEVPEDAMVALGPEGGWTDGEREQFLQTGWTRVSLGSQILRAETAGIAALAVLQAGLSKK
jgi:16S rRNA (uracil1498-N3)-methyltransferase